ncbi:LysR family transcriptional regulator [Novosphingobium kaempferiae]|uniref:LysR family transcriptional regulator n=1 Tax=Novosphingobium kaempferiae TaxID=2896849 RepID=UPI001E5A245B|nr:LysR family transcriptional regulator [Novosphingobium kaempferiae]
MPHIPDFEAWAIFAKVAEVGSFSHAAEELGLASTTVSKAITRLEQRMQTTLFHRTTRKLSLTETGRLTVERAARILADGRAIEADIVEEAAIPRGKVRVACPTAFGLATIVPILPSFLLEYPDIELDLCLTEDEVDLIGSGFDVCLRLGQPPDSTLRTVRLLSFIRPLVAAPSLIEKLGMPAHPAELARYPAIIPTNVPWGVDWEFDHPDHGPATVRMAGRFHINHAGAVVPAAVAGIGVALLPDFFIARELEDGSLVRILPEWSAATKSAYMVTPPGVARPARVRVLIEWLRGHYARQDRAQRDRAEGA